jgi:hypothetical protein
MMSKDEWRMVSQLLAVRNILENPNISDWARTYWTKVYVELATD